MLYELRTYHAMPAGCRPQPTFRRDTMDFFKKHNIQVVGFWTNELGGSSDQLIYMLAYDSLADREKSGAGSSRQGSAGQVRETEKNGPAAPAHRPHPPADAYSPMQ